VYLLGSLGMLSTIQFDDEARIKAGEVDDIISNRRLAAKAEAGELFVAQPPPERLFGIGKLVA
jgi:hypothetical protein